MMSIELATALLARAFDQDLSVSDPSDVPLLLHAPQRAYEPRIDIDVLVPFLDGDTTSESGEERRDMPAHPGCYC